MKRYTVSVREPDPATIAEVAAIVRGGGVVAYPTDTLYGLAVDPRTDEAVERLFDVKGREAARGHSLDRRRHRSGARSGQCSAISKCAWHARSGPDR